VSLPLQGRIAVVAGASSGIGLATARALAEAGAEVHALARRREAIEEAAPGVQAHRLDVTDAAAVGEVIGAIERIDVLVCAAGINIPDRRFEQMTPESWDALIATNLSGPFYVLRAALEAVRATRGLAILIGSVSGSWPDVSGAAYQASKAGLLALSRAAGFEEHEHGVRVSAVLPGIVDTPLLDQRPSPPGPAVRAAALRSEDVAAACLFLATLPPRAHVPELTMLPTGLQALGKTGTATPRPE
jgi:NAD(P)-dependent dehydrogenase (short-subunit alcohol dehydrogenase family)